MVATRRLSPILAISLIASAMLTFAFYRHQQPDRQIIEAFRHGSDGTTVQAMTQLAVTPANDATLQELIRMACDPSVSLSRRRYAVTAFQVAGYRPAVGPLLSLLEQMPWPTSDENLPGVILRTLEPLAGAEISPRVARCMNQFALNPKQELNTNNAMALAHFAITHPHADLVEPLGRLADRLSRSSDENSSSALVVTLTAMGEQPLHPRIVEQLTFWSKESQPPQVRRQAQQLLAKLVKTHALSCESDKTARDAKNAP